MQGLVQKDPAELRASLLQRFPTVPAQRVDEVIAVHGSDEDTCIAHLLAAAYNEGGSSADGQVCFLHVYTCCHNRAAHIHAHIRCRTCNQLCKRIYNQLSVPANLTLLRCELSTVPLSIVQYSEVSCCVISTHRVISTS